LIFDENDSVKYRTKRDASRFRTTLVLSGQTLLPG
jgi:hypothetical protein